jgi:chloramphenicol 3-O phosphotransferase
MGTAVIVLNGTSSSGKSSIARCLQDLLPAPWLTLGVDTLIEAMPRRLIAHEAGILIDPDGHATVGAEFRTFEAAWYAGYAAMARGAGLIIDDVFLGGASSQSRLRSALEGHEVLWVAVRCRLEVAARREAERQDRTPGMAASQEQLVHVGVDYDVEVDTTTASAIDCARLIAARVAP